MAFSKNYSFSAQTFLKFYDSLATATHDARQIANDLYSRNVIERKCLHRISRKENERPSQWLAKELFLATHEVLCVTPSKFPNVLEALRCDSSLNPLCDQMEQTQGMHNFVPYSFSCVLYVNVIRVVPSTMR